MLDVQTCSLDKCRRSCPPPFTFVFPLEVRFQDSILTKQAIDNRSNQLLPYLTPRRLRTVSISISMVHSPPLPPISRGRLEAGLPLFRRSPVSRSYHAARRLSRGVRSLKSFSPESSVRLGKPVDSEHGRDLHNEQYVVKCSAIIHLSSPRVRILFDR